MIRLLALLVLAGASVNAQTITQTFGSGANAFSIDFVQIGNPGNAADTTGTPNPAGSVSYIYNLGKYEVSRDMIIKANTAGGLGLTLEDMTNYGGNGLNRPATGISWNEAARFVNWLNAIKGYAPAYNFTSSGGNDYITVWASGQYVGNNQFRHKNAYYFLPSIDEWYKGAYGSPSGTWYNYSTGSDTAPTAVSGGTAGGTTVYGQLNTSGPADITNAGGLSGYGTMAQGGNAYEWIETAFDGTNDLATEFRITRGGSWYSGTSDSEGAYLSSLSYVDPAADYLTSGFRVASIPEPSSFSLFLAGGALLLSVRRKGSPKNSI